MLSDIRQGFGYDLHRTIQGRPLILGGVLVPSDFGLDGHSDADVVCHAITDAILGALALGDIGTHFPDTDSAYKNADSISLLVSVIEMAHHAGYYISNADVTIIAERPKLAEFKTAMAEKLATVMKIDVARVSVKAKTNEGVDATGQSTAIAAYAVVLLLK